MVKRLSLPVPIRVCWFIFVCYVSLFMFVSLFIKTNEIPKTAESQNPTFSWYFLRLRFTMIKQYIHVIKIRLVQVKLLLFLPCLDWWSSIFSEVFPLYGCLSVRVIFLWHVSQQILTSDGCNNKHTFCLGMPYRGKYFCANRMPKSCKC